MKRFKRLAAVVSLSLIITIIIVPCAVFFANAQTADNATTTQSTTDSTSSERVTKSYVDDKNLTNKQTKETVEKAKSFDSAKKTAKETATVAKYAKEVISKQPAATISVGGKYLLNIANPDPSYVSYSIELSAYDRDLLERLVMGEAGAEGYIGCCLVAQAIRDTMISDGYTSIDSLRINMGYYGAITRTPNQDVLDAVKFIFDEGGAAVQHDIKYFYAPALCTSGWHESQEFVVAHNSHRFFDKW